MGKEKLIMWLVGMLLERVKSEEVKKWIDAGIDLLEDKIVETPNKVDDMVVLPVLKILREAMSIPDND